MPTSAPPAETPVGPRGYLSDTALAADGIRGFVETLGALAPEITPAEARTAAPGLRQDAGIVDLAYRRLAAERVEDTRLEGQRKRVTPALGEVAQIMARIATLAEAGKAPEMAALVPDLEAAIAALRTAGG